MDIKIGIRNRVMLPFAGLQNWRLADGRALADISIPTKCEVTMVLIMKDGKIYKNAVK